MTQGLKPVLRARAPNAHPVLYASSGHNRTVRGQLFAWLASCFLPLPPLLT